MSLSSFCVCMNALRLNLLKVHDASHDKKIHFKKKEIKESDEPEKLIEKYKKEYEDTYYNPYYAASIGMIDEVILPDETRQRILQAIKTFKNKEKVYPAKRHGNMPL